MNDILPHNGTDRGDRTETSAITLQMAPLLLTIEQAAAVLGVSARVLSDLTTSGELPSLSIGTSVRYDPRDLVGWIDARKAATAAYRELVAEAADGATLGTDRLKAVLARVGRSKSRFEGDVQRALELRRRAATVRLAGPT